MARMVESFRGVPDVELTVVCGNAKPIEAPDGVRATILGFEKNMPARVAAADVVVGKAGGLTVTETLTAGRPMVIASAIPGNEAVNASFVEEGGAGVSAEPEVVGETIDRLRERGRLRAMGRAARALVPRHAAGAVVDIVEGFSRRRSCFRESA